MKYRYVVIAVIVVIVFYIVDAIYTFAGKPNPINVVVYHYLYKPLFRKSNEDADGEEEEIQVIPDISEDDKPPKTYWLVIKTVIAAVIVYLFSYYFDKIPGLHMYTIFNWTKYTPFGILDVLRSNAKSTLIDLVVRNEWILPDPSLVRGAPCLVLLAVLPLNIVFSILRYAPGNLAEKLGTLFSGRMAVATLHMILGAAAVLAVNKLGKKYARFKWFLMGGVSEKSFSAWCWCLMLSSAASAAFAIASSKRDLLEVLEEAHQVSLVMSTSFGFSHFVTSNPFK